MNVIPMKSTEEEIKKFIDPRKHLIALFNQKYLEVTGRKNPFPFAACMKAIKTFEKEDEETGEILIEYPDEETWLEQADGFFRDDFARENRGLHFTYFLKQFGSFKRFGKFQEKVRETEKRIDEETPPMDKEEAARFNQYAKKKCSSMWYAEEDGMIIFHGPKLKKVYSDFINTK